MKIMIQKTQWGIILLIGMFACTSQSGVDLPSDLSVSAKVVVNGQWRITYFFDSDREETSKFAGYTFAFNEDDTVKVTRGTTTVAGMWSITHNGSNDDMKSGHFNLTFSGNDTFDELNEDWNFIFQNSQKIELIHISGGNGGTDYLTFEKN